MGIVILGIMKGNFSSLLHARQIMMSRSSGSQTMADAIRAILGDKPKSTLLFGAPVSDTAS